MSGDHDHDWRQRFYEAFERREALAEERVELIRGLCRQLGIPDTVPDARRRERTTAEIREATAERRAKNDAFAAEAIWDAS